MTSSVEQPSALQAIFELYSVLDRVAIAALESGRPDQATIVDQYLPGASANAGWSDEIKAFFELPDPAGSTSDTDITESVNNALSSLTTHIEGDSALTIPEQSNLVYAIGALAHLDFEKTAETIQLFTDVLQIASPEGDEGIKSTNASSLLQLLLQAFNGYESWPDVIKFAAAPEQGWVKSDIAKVPQCRTAVVTVNGYECVVIDADIESDVVTFNNLINVVDPRNWPKSYPSFFCGMSGDANRNDNWYDIVEKAGFCTIPPPYTYRLTTKLKFIKTDQIENLDARLDYDLSEIQDGGCDKKVKVDRGFVNVRCMNPAQDPSQGGVLMRTRKVAHVTGLSPYAQAFWLCKLGYGWAAVYTFFSPAAQSSKAGSMAGYTPWKSPPYQKEDPKVTELPSTDGTTTADATPSTGASPTGTTGTSPALGVATKTAETLKETAEFLTEKNLEVTKKYLANQLDFGDLAAISAQVGAKLASEPWRWLHKIVTPGPSSDSTGSGGPTP